jgi:uncharacterized protein YgiM (DUF1202 family)
VSKPSTLIKLAFVALLIGLLLELFDSGESSWAAVDQGLERQTVPTRTPSPTPVTPTATPTATAPVTPSPTPTRPATSPTPAKSPTPTAAPALVTVTADTNVFIGPGFDYPVLGSLKAGQTAVVVGRNVDHSWWQILFRGRAAWIPASVATPNAEARRAPVVTVSPAGIAGSTPPTLPTAGGETWVLFVGVFLLANGALLLLAGLRAGKPAR